MGVEVSAEGPEGGGRDGSRGWLSYVQNAHRGNESIEGRQDIT